MLARALDSVERQTHRATEVLVVDDGSTDDTQAMVETRFPKAVYLSQSNRGVSAARNRGIRAAHGDWIAFLDSDDEWLAEKLRRQVAAIDAEPSSLLCHCDEIWIRNGMRVNPGARHRAAKVGGRIFRDCLPLCAISPSSALVHRSVFDQIGGFDEDLPACEDYDFWLRFTAIHPVLYVDEPLLLKHGGHDDQLSRSVDALDRYRIRALVKVIETLPLEAGDRLAAVAMLRAKIRIYAAGARKRGRFEEVRELEDLAARAEPGQTLQVGGTS